VGAVLVPHRQDQEHGFLRARVEGVGAEERRRSRATRGQVGARQGLDVAAGEVGGGDVVEEGARAGLQGQAAQRGPPPPAVPPAPSGRARCRSTKNVSTPLPASSSRAETSCTPAQCGLVRGTSPYW